MSGESELPPGWCIEEKAGPRWWVIDHLGTRRVIRLSLDDAIESAWHVFGITREEFQAMRRDAEKGRAAQRFFDDIGDVSIRSRLVEDALFYEVYEPGSEGASDHVYGSGASAIEAFASMSRTFGFLREPFADAIIAALGENSFQSGNGCGDEKGGA